VNRDCNGDYFIAEGLQYYRCLLDGSVLQSSQLLSVCPHCERNVDAQDLGTLKTRTILQAFNPQFKLWMDIRESEWQPIETAPKDKIIQERAIDNGENDYYRRRSRYHAEVAVVICIAAVVLIALWVILS
jgi:hypothetical protein